MVNKEGAPLAVNGHLPPLGQGVAVKVNGLNDLDCDVGLSFAVLFPTR
jgi:hypothetical protein